VGRYATSCSAVLCRLEISPGYALAQRAMVFLDLERGNATGAVARARRAVDEDPGAIRLATLGVAAGIGRTD
jgi:hypothetical protein